jgi:hypothetical protein
MRFLRNCSAALAVALSLTCASAQSNPVQRSGQVNAAAIEQPLRVEQVREFLKLSGAGEIYRSGWMASLAANQAKGEPYWPESFWNDLRDEMRKTDLAPMVLELYMPFISDEMMQSANEYLRTHSMSQLAATPLGAKFCKLQQEADVNSQAETLKLTQATFMRVYERDQPQIKAAREKYLAAHPDYKD